MANIRNGFRKRILTLLEASNGLTASELGEKLNTSATAIRRHMKVLEEQHLVAHEKEQRGVGRPSYVYRLDSAVPSLAIQSYDAFVQSILEEADRVDCQADLYELFRERQARRYETHINQNSGETLQERVAVLARLLEWDGRLTSWQQVDDGRYILRQHNCPLQQIARGFRPACRCELHMFREILQTEIQRLDHIVDGGVACVYEIVERPVNARNDSTPVLDARENARHPNVLRDDSIGSRIAVPAD
jgi:predicted ArsR family transcriptional regulator